MIALEDIKISQRDLLRVIHQQLKDLPMLPNVVLQAMQTVNDPKTSADELGKLIGMDQALSAKVLRLVNSAHYGFASKVTTITHAIVILGFETVRNLVTALGVAQSFQADRRSLLDRDAFWSHSAATAVAASAIARERKLSAKVQEEVFVGGLLHDIGKLFLDQFFSDQYRYAIQLAALGKVSMDRAESTALGVNHMLVGKRIADNWRLPSLAASMIAMHHAPEPSAGHFELVATVHAADIVAKRLKLGWSGDDIVPTIDSQVDQWLGFGQAKWDAVDRQTAERYEKAREFIQVLS